MKLVLWMAAIAGLVVSTLIGKQPRVSLATEALPEVVPEVPDKLLDLFLKKCEDAKKDLEANLNHHIISVGLSIGLVLGLGESLSVLLLKDRIFEKVLFLVVPLSNLYFFMRFGGLAIVFAEARYALKGLSEEYFREQHVAAHPATAGIRASSLYVTNSYFDPYFRERGAIGLPIYELSFPLILALSHALSFYLLGSFTKSWTTRAIIWAIYALPILVLYSGFYGGMREVVSSERANAGSRIIAWRIRRAVMFCFVFSAAILAFLYIVDFKGLFSTIVPSQHPSTPL
jgi:hypothetical protein